MRIACQCCVTDAAQKCDGKNRNDDEWGRNIHDQNPRFQPSTKATARSRKANFGSIQIVPRGTIWDFLTPDRLRIVSGGLEIGSICGWQLFHVEQFGEEVRWVGDRDQPEISIVPRRTFLEEAKEGFSCQVFLL